MDSNRQRLGRLVQTIRLVNWDDNKSPAAVLSLRVFPTADQKNNSHSFIHMADKNGEYDYLFKGRFTQGLEMAAWLYMLVCRTPQCFGGRRITDFPTHFLYL